MKTENLYRLDNIVPFAAVHPGELIRDELKERDMTQKQLAEKLGLNQQDISRYETEQIDLSTEMIRKFCEFFPI